MKTINPSSRGLCRVSSARQGGVALVVALIFLLVLSFLGLAAMQGSTMEERMANNLTDRNLAYQAAELALRDGQRDLSGLLANGTDFCPGGTTKSINSKTVTCRKSTERSTLSTSKDQAEFWHWGDANMNQSWTPSARMGNACR